MRKVIAPLPWFCSLYSQGFRTDGTIQTGTKGLSAGSVVRNQNENLGPAFSTKRTRIPDESILVITVEPE